MNALRVVLTLTLTATLLGGLVAAVAYYAVPRIEHNREVAATKHQLELEGYAEHYVRTLESDSHEMPACSKRVTTIRSSSNGYGGKIHLIVAFVGDKLVRLRVTSHSETPGFSKVLEPDDWISQFGIKEFDAIDTVSRATITTNAVLRATGELRAQLTSDLRRCNEI